MTINTHKQARRPIAGYKQFPERKRRNARARKHRQATEQTRTGGDRTHDHTRPTERPRNTQKWGRPTSQIGLEGLLELDQRSLARTVL